MPKLVITNLNHKEFVFEISERNLLQQLQEQNQDFMFACGGKGRCTTCKVLVEMGQEFLSEPSPAEMRFREQGRLASNERLTCQCSILTAHADEQVIVSIPLSGQLPHLQYS